MYKILQQQELSISKSPLFGFLLETCSHRVHYLTCDRKVARPIEPHYTFISVLRSTVFIPALV